jgi:anthranilate phosphoribosyltransferase
VTLPDSLEPSDHDRHPFAAVVRAIGRGPGRGRSLTLLEARAAMAAMLAGAVRPEQIGALLMLLRYRAETPEETAGFVQAVLAHTPQTALGRDIDWPSYADGAPRIAPWHFAAAKLAATAGLTTVFHGPLGGAGRDHIAGALATLDIPVVDQPASSAPVIFCPVERFAPRFADLLDLRGVLGLRSPLNTVARLTNPFQSRVTFDGVFHPPYLALHLAAAALLGHRSLGVVKGGGGEALRTPVKPVTLHWLHEGAVAETVWQPLGADTPARPAAPTDTAHMAAVWAGADDPRAVAAIIGTAAIALYIAGRAASPAAAEALATSLWRAR